MKYVYSFGDGKADGKADMKNLLGGKGANLAEMNLLNIPVPPLFNWFGTTLFPYVKYTHTKCNPKKNFQKKKRTRYTTFSVNYEGKTRINESFFEKNLKLVLFFFFLVQLIEYYQTL